MKILLKILVAPFVLALSLLAVFLFDIYAFLLTIALVILAVLGIGVLSALGTGRRKIRSVSVSDKLTSGQHGPKWKGWLEATLSCFILYLHTKKIAGQV